MSDRRPHASSSSNSPAAEATDDPRVFVVVEEYLAELQQGRVPDRREYLERYPELAEAIGQCIDGLDFVHGDVAARGEQQLEGLAAQAADERMAEPLGDFKILREIARGGMGVVYEAIQLSLGRRVALKVLPLAATVDPRQLQRFKIEAQAAALLHHTHIVPVYAFGCDRGVHYYAMQLIEGESLATLIERLGDRSDAVSESVRKRQTPEVGTPRETTPETCDFPVEPNRAVQRATGDAASDIELETVIPSAAKTAKTVVKSTGTTVPASAGDSHIRVAARWMMQAAQALEHAHQAGVIHRDIKPANLLVDPAGNLWVTDFGLAQLHADNGLTRSGDLVGTFRYMSPEQTSGQRGVLDQRTDVFSLGATFYELLTLQPACPGETHQELLFQILHVEPRGLRELNRAVPRELETIVLKSIDKNPADRYRTAGELAADIQRYLDHQPILARRPSLLDRMRKWSRRHPAVVIAGILLLAVIATASLISNRLISIEQRRTTEAFEREKVRAIEAEERFLMARQAVDALLQISEEELTDRPMESARRRILEVVLSHYQDFIEQREGNPASQAELASVQGKVRRILHELEVLQREWQSRMLNFPIVQEDLALSLEQQKRLEELFTQWREQHPRGRGLANMSDEERRSQLVAAAEEFERNLAEVLTPTQRRRFQQISIQDAGIRAFQDPEIVRALSLTPAQRHSIRQVGREFLGRRGGPGPGGRGFGGPDPDGLGFGGPGPAGRGPAGMGPAGPGPGGFGPRGVGLRGSSFGLGAGESEFVGEGFGGRRGPARGGFGSGGPRRGGRGKGGPGGPFQPEFRPFDPPEEWLPQVLSLLTPEQQQIWHELIGERLEGMGERGLRAPSR